MPITLLGLDEGKSAAVRSKAMVLLLLIQGLFFVFRSRFVMQYLVTVYSSFESI